MSTLICIAKPNSNFLTFINKGITSKFYSKSLVGESLRCKKCNEEIHKMYIKQGIHYSEVRKLEIQHKIIKRKLNIANTYELVFKNFFNS